MDNDLIPGIGIKSQLGELKEYKGATIEDLHRLVEDLQKETSVQPLIDLESEEFLNLKKWDADFQRKFMYGLTDEEIDKTNI